MSNQRAIRHAIEKVRMAGTMLASAASDLADLRQGIAVMEVDADLWDLEGEVCYADQSLLAAVEKCRKAGRLDRP